MCVFLLFIFFFSHREEWELGGHKRSEEKAKVGTEDQKVIFNMKFFPLK